MKLLIVTRADDNIAEMCSITHPIIIDYAKRCGAEFMILNEQYDVPNQNRHYRIMACGELCKKYSRILNIDSDVLISPLCPDIFKATDPNYIYSVFEDKGSRMVDRRERINKAIIRFGKPYTTWSEGYINTGFFLVSNIHKPIFQPIKGEYWNDLGFDDVMLGYQIRNFGFLVQDLGYKWNCMSMFEEKWCGANRFDSYISHYAGKGFDKNKSRLEQIKADKKVWWGE